MDCVVEFVCGESKALNADETIRVWPTEVIEKVIDASVWKHFKEAIFDRKSTFKMSEIRTVEIAEWAVANSLELDSRVAKIMVSKGYVDVLEYLCSKGLSWYCVVLETFRTEGSVEIVEWLYVNGHLFKGGFIIDETYVYVTAVVFNRVDICKWAFSKGLRYTWATRGRARRSNDPEIREWGLSLPMV